MICLFGLFHGLVLLPVVLSIFGPLEPEEENKNKNSVISEPEPNKVFSLKFVRTLLSEKQFKQNERKDLNINQEMENLKSNGVTENLLEKHSSEENVESKQANGGDNI